MLSKKYICGKQVHRENFERAACDLHCQVRLQQVFVRGITTVLLLSTQRTTWNVRESFNLERDSNTDHQWCCTIELNPLQLRRI